MALLLLIILFALRPIAFLVALAAISSRDFLYRIIQSSKLLENSVLKPVSILVQKSAVILVLMMIITTGNAYSSALNSSSEIMQSTIVGISRNELNSPSNGPASLILALVIGFIYYVIDKNKSAEYDAKI